MPRPKRLIPIKWSLLRNSIVIIVVLSLSTLGTIAVLGGRAAQALSGQFIDQTVKIVEQDVGRHIRSIEEQLLLMAELMAAGDMDPAKTSDVNALLMRVMRNSPEIAVAQIGDTQGNAYFLERRGEGWLSRLVFEQDGKRLSRIRQFDDVGIVQRDFLEAAGRDPRSSEWYAAGMEAGPGEAAWCEPYRFALTREKIVAASTLVLTTGNRSYVLSLAARLRDLGRIVDSISPSPNGFVSLLSLEGEVLGVPARALGANGASDAFFMKLAEELPSPILALSFRRWQEMLGNEGQPLTVSSGGERFWVRFRSYRAGQADLFLLGVFVPERDFMENVKRQGLLILILAGLASVAAGVFAVYLAKGFSRPLEALAEQTGKICDLILDDEIAPVSSHIGEVRTLGDAHARMRQTLSSFIRYIPMEIVRTLIRRGETAAVGGKTSDVTILFTETEEYLGLTDSMEAGELLGHLSSYFQAATDVLSKRLATIDKYLGGGLMAFWNQPSEVGDHPVQAAFAAFECLSALTEANRDWRAKGLPELTTRFGLHRGEAVVGNVGSHDRLNYTALGDSVNLASRLVHLNAFYGTNILVSESVQAAIAGTFATRRVDKVAVKGKTQGIFVFELLGPAGEVAPQLAAFVRDYEKALEAYLDGRFAEADEAFAELTEKHPERRCVRVLGERCRKLLEEPPGDWSGVFLLRRKYQGRAV